MDIHRYRFFYFLFQFWIFEFWTSSYKNESSLLLFHITCISYQFADFVVFAMLLAILYFCLEYCVQAVVRTFFFFFFFFFFEGLVAWCHSLGNYSGFDCGLLVFFTHSILTSCIQRTIVDSPAFLEHGLVEKIEVRAHTTYVPNK